MNGGVGIRSVWCLTWLHALLIRVEVLDDMSLCFYYVVCGLWSVVCGLWSMVCGMRSVVCGLWYAVIRLNAGTHCMGVRSHRRRPY